MTYSRTHRGHVVVVGAGIAGAGAANRLRHNGFEVTVLEAEPYVGGRTATLRQDGFKIDLAATMLLTSYRRMVELIAEEGWESHFEPANDVIGVERASAIHRIKSSKPRTALTTGLLSLSAKLRLAAVAKDAIAHRRQLDWQDPVRAADLHYGNVREYADARVRSSEIRDYLIDPACRFLGLSSLAETSAVDFLFLAKNMGMTKLFNSPDGIDTLVRLLTGEVTVETDARVDTVEEGPSGVTVGWSRAGESANVIEADACILAVPAPLTAQLYPQMGAERAAIMNSVVYAPSVNVHFGVQSPPQEPAALILIPQVDYAELACVILDHNKTTGRTPPGQGLISSYWQNNWSRAQSDQPDEAVIAAAVPAIDKLLPGAVDNPSTVHVQRWRNALVTGPIGRYHDLERFKRLTPSSSRVRFAGDAVSSSTMNSCLCSGERAADEVTAALTGR